MIQYPVNIYPQDIAIDANAITQGAVPVSFTFNGDVLTDIILRFYNYNSGEIIKTVFYSGQYYNGSNVSLPYLSADFVNGQDYVLQMILAQKNNDSDIYDMPVLSGKVAKQQSATGDNSKILVESGITSIYEWGEDNGFFYPTKDDDDRIITGMVLEINGERRFIEYYQSDITVGSENVSFGLIKTSSAFSFTVESGMRYKIFSNYLITPQYYFKCRTAPVIAPAINYGAENIYCTATYQQSENVMIKYFNLSLWASKNAGYGYSKLSESGKIFAQNIYYYFNYSYLGVTPWVNEGGTDYPENVYYKLVCDVVTQDNVSASGETVLNIGNNPTELDYTKYLKIDYILNNSLNTVDFKTGVAQIKSKLFRTDLKTGTTRQIPITSRDYNVSSHGNYRYTLIPYDSNGLPYVKNIVKKDVITDFTGYTITALKEPVYIAGDDRRENFKQLIAGDTWKFICDISNTSITQNTDKVLHVGYGGYTGVSSTDANYLSGTLSAMLGTITCEEKVFHDEIEIVNAWREFILQPVMFLLKSQKGDVLLVNVVNSPVTEYQEDYYKVPVRFSFDWVQCGNADEILIVRGD